MAVSYRSGSDYSVDVRNVQVAPGHTVGLVFDENTNTIAIESNGADPVTYQVDVKRINSDGVVDQFSDGVSRGGAAGVRLMVGEEWTGDGAPVVETIQESTLPAPTVVQEELALLDAAQNNTYAVESNAGGDESPWLPDGVWVIGGRQDQRVVTLNITSDDSGQTLAGTMTYAGEGPIALRANKTEQNVYRVEVQWGGADAPWNPDGTWVLGTRADHSVVALELGSDDDGNTLDGTVSYADGSFFGFRATLQPASPSDELDATTTEAEETGAAPEPTSSGEAPAAEETAGPTPEPAAELPAALAQADRFPLLPGQTVEREQKIFSESGAHYLIFQPDGNVVVHTVDDQYVWGLQSVTDKYAQAQSVKMEPDGNFVVRGADDVYIWSALTANPDASAYLTLTPAGVLRLVSGATGATLWASDGDLSPVAPTVEPTPEAAAEATAEATGEATAETASQAPAEAPATVTDADGNVYPTVRVGDQLWMAENLRTVTCSDGAAIPLVSDQDAWVTQTAAAYTWGRDVAGDAQAEAEYGALYNAYAAALPCNVCPSGWRVPTQADFQTLLDSQGTDAHLKLSDPAFWGPDNQATNASGWSARPAGGAGGDTPGSYDFGQFAYFWSAAPNTQDTNYLMVIHGADAGAQGTAGLRYGFSIRCVQDLPVAEAPAATAHTVHWAYAGDEAGPENWGELDHAYAACSDGLTQSPIDITVPQPEDLANLVIAYRPSPLRVHNNGHTVVANYAAGSYIEVDGERYFVDSLHYHTPSEHIVDGQPADAELHIVHKKGDELAVIGILLKEGAENPAYQPLLDNLPGEEGPAVNTGVTINAADLLPAEQTTYRYSGSLTTPPCTEGVRWLVMTTPVELSADQLAAFQAVFAGNARPVQPLNEREPVVDTTP
jgi:carbonic anhydrase